MTDLKNTGVAMAVLERFENERLETALAIKAKVEQGGLLSDTDVDFLKEVLVDCEEAQHTFEEAPDWQPIYTQIVHLYHDIMARALANEQAAHPDARPDSPNFFTE